MTDLFDANFAINTERGPRKECVPKSAIWGKNAKRRMYKRETST